MTSKSDRIRNRLIRRLTTPAELFYALSAHWMVIFAFLAIGTAVLYAKVMTDPPVWRGSASLIITSGDSLLADAASPVRQSRSRDEFLAFYNSQVEILQSDSVFGGIVDAMNPGNFEEPQETEEQGRATGFKKYVRGIREAVKDVMASLQRADFRDTGPGFAKERAIDILRRQSAVEANLKNGTVRLVVLGRNRDLIEKQLNQWRESYVDFLVKMEQETSDIFFSSRLDYWRKEEVRAGEDLSRFLAQARKELSEQHGQKIGEISEQAREILYQQIMQLQMQYYSLQGQIEGLVPGPGTTGGAGTVDRSREALITQQAELQKQLNEALSFHGKDSVTVRALRDQLERVEAQLEGRDTGEPGDPAAKKRARAEERLATLSAEISASLALHGALGRSLERARDLKAEVEKARQEKQKYQGIVGLQLSGEDFRQHAQVKWADKPHVDWEPYNAYPQRQVLFGALGGLGVGIVFALLREVLNGKVRFKNDIVGEYGKPVVAVVLRKG